MKIYGRTIAARPAQADPGDIFINLEDDKRYVYGADGYWSHQLPVTPGVMKVGYGLDVAADGTVSVSDGIVSVSEE